jgi:hypothetical protein
VAASSFDMEITDPRDLLKQIDLDRVRQIQGLKQKVSATRPRSSGSPVYVEPAPVEDPPAKPSVIPKVDEQIKIEDSIVPTNTAIRRGKIQRLGDFIDTDAVSP